MQLSWQISEILSDNYVELSYCSQTPAIEITAIENIKKINKSGPKGSWKVIQYFGFLRHPQFHQ